MRRSLVCFSSLRSKHFRASVGFEFGSSLKNARMFASMRAGQAQDPVLPIPPKISKLWLAAASNKMLQPHHVLSNSRKLVWWRCAHCQQEYTRRVDVQVRADGECPHCGKHPASRIVRSTGAGLQKCSEKKKKLVHLSRPKTSVGVLEALNPNRIQKSVADNAYLSQHERRILLPMLAKNFEKERSKIAPDETVFVSPKLDGIRCVAAYSRKANNVLLFSRAGTLFECGDKFIEPALKRLFEKDPTLVLDGELYNDFTNLSHLRKMSKKQSSRFSWLTTASPSEWGSETIHGLDDINFETLTSVVRTSRANRTLQVEALQNQLQYHIFDVLYSSRISGVRSPFSERLSVLQKIFKEEVYPLTRCGSRKERRHQVLRLVPAAACQVVDVDQRLAEAIAVGYEGLMVRRDQVGVGGKDVEKPAPAGYAYGQRSGALLKYKVMQDDEFIIVDAVEGKGKLEGCLGAFVCRAKRNAEMTFSVSFAVPQEEKRRLWSNKQARDYIGMALTVQYQELTPEGIPRFPVGKSVRGTHRKKEWI